MPRMTNTVNFDSFFIYGSDTSVFTDGVSARGIPMRPNESLFILDQPLSITFPRGNSTPLIITSRLVRVADHAMANWRNQRIFFGNTYLIAVFDCSVQGNDRFRWIPNNVFFPANQTTTQQRLELTLTYDTRTNIRSWLDNSDLNRFKEGNYDLAHTLSGGGLVTHSTINTFAFIRWTERFPIMISHIPLSIRRTGSISIEMPTVGTRIRVINRDGTMGSSEVRDLGIEMATNEKALFFILPNDISSDSTPDSGLLLVDNGAPLASYNPNPLWILICSVSPQDRSILWNPGRVNIPRPFQPGELRSYSFSSFNGNMSWIPLANRRQANVDSSGNPLPLSGSLSETGLGKTADVTDYPLTLEDITKGRKQINIVYDSSCNKISFDSSTLNSTLALYHSRLPKTPKQIGARIKFDSTIVYQWGNQTLTEKHLFRKSVGQLDILFPTPLNSRNYGVQLSMLSDKPGILQYSNTTERGFSILTYDLSGKLITFDGDFTVDILT